MMHTPEFVLSNQMTMYLYTISETQWLPGVIKELSGTNSFKVQLDNNHIVQRHADHIQARQADCVFPASSNDYDDVLPCPIAVPTSLVMRLHRLFHVGLKETADRLTVLKLRGERCGIFNKNHKLVYYTL